MRLTDLGVAHRGAIGLQLRRANATGDPSPGSNRTSLIVLMAAGLALLLALAAVWALVARRRRPVAVEPDRVGAHDARFPDGRDLLRARVSVALDERGAEVLILGLGLAAAVALGALIAS